jgi:hypothetical protein
MQQRFKIGRFQQPRSSSCLRVIARSCQLMLSPWSAA